MAEGAAGGVPASTPEQQLRRLLETEPNRADAWHSLGLLAFQQGRHADAAASLEKAASLAPGQPAFHQHLALCCQALGRREQAARHFLEVARLSPESPDAHNNKGMALAQVGRRDEAIAAFEHALRLNPRLHEAHSNWGNTLFELGRHEEAVDRFRQAVTLCPAFAPAQHNLGVALSKLGRPDEALVSFLDAVRAEPKYADAHFQLANLSRDAGRLDEAAKAYRRVLELRPEHRDARPQLAAVLARQGRLDDAAACLHQALLFHPDSADTYNNLGVLLAQRDRADEAAAAFRQALRLAPEHADALNNLGNVLLRQQKTDEAVDCFRKALGLRQDRPQPHCNLGCALSQQARHDEAAGHFREAIKLDPGYVDAHFHLGNAHRALGRPEDALGCFRKALELQPGHGGACLNLGVALSELGRMDEAVELFEGLLAKSPDFGPAYNSLGVARLHQGRPEEGLAAFGQAVRCQPDEADGHLNKAICLLQLGRLEEGWQEYEWRWKLKKAPPCPHPLPAWDGKPLPGGTIVLWCEQGLGDTLQFVRYAALVKARVGTVLLDCPGPLRGLLASCPGVDGLVGQGTTVPQGAVQAPLLGLPRLLKTTLESVPATVPYLFADAALRERWRDKVGPARGLKVGLFWQGNPQYAGDRFRSVRLEQLRPLAAVPGVRLFSLQKGKGAEQLTEQGAGLEITDLGSQISGDFRDTAAALANLDLVVSVDTAVAHLAGALGVPVWLLLPFNPDWRWLRGREDSVWYPTARLFRQGRWGDWDGVVLHVAEALRHQARRPLLQRFALRVGLAELVERAVRAEGHNGAAAEGWAALRQAGLDETAEVARYAGRLRAALKEEQDVTAQMQGLGDAPARRARGLVRRFLRIQEEQTAAREQFSAWLAGAAAGEPGA
jgi:tetratricopeptide (TPR) repeat protein